MPYYKNISSETLIVPDTAGTLKHVVPNGMIATYTELSGTRWTKLSDLPVDSDRTSLSTTSYGSAVPISVISAATTFTTLTYADNEGKVQLSSAGVHGLTTSPAVGASVYVTWAGGTGVSGLYKVLSVDSTKLVTIDRAYATGLGTPTVKLADSEITLTTIALPALRANSKVVASASFTMTGSANSKTAYIYWGTVAVSSLANTTEANVDVRLPEVRISNRGATNSQVLDTLANNAGAATGISTATINTSAATNMTIRTKAAVANEVMTLEVYSVELTL